MIRCLSHSHRLHTRHGDNRAELAFLTLSTPEIQNELRTPGSHAPMYIAAGYLIFAVLTLIAGTTGDMFGRKRVMVVGLVGLHFANLAGALILGKPLFVVTDVLASICVVAVLPMVLPPSPGSIRWWCAHLPTLCCSDPSARRLLSAPHWEEYLMPWVSLAVSFFPVVIVGVIAIRQVLRYVPKPCSESVPARQRSGEPPAACDRVRARLLCDRWEEFLRKLAAGACGGWRSAGVGGVCALAQAARPVFQRC